MRRVIIALTVGILVVALAAWLAFRVVVDEPTDRGDAEVVAEVWSQGRPATRIEILAWPEAATDPVGATLRWAEDDGWDFNGCVDSQFMRPSSWVTHDGVKVDEDRSWRMLWIGEAADYLERGSPEAAGIRSQLNDSDHNVSRLVVLVHIFPEGPAPEDSCQPGEDS